MCGLRVLEVKRLDTHHFFSWFFTARFEDTGGSIPGCLKPHVTDYADDNEHDHDDDDDDEEEKDKKKIMVNMMGMVMIQGNGEDDGDDND